MAKPKEYRYRAHIRWGQYIIPAFFALPILGLWIIPLISVLAGGSSSSLLLALFLPLSLILTVEAIVLWLVFYRMAGTQISVQAEGLSYTDRQGTMIIPFPAITKLEFPSLQYLGGWVKICSPQKTIRLTVVFEDIGDFLREIKFALDQHGLSDRYDRKKMVSFFKTAVYCDQSWARLYRIFWRMILATLLAGLISFLLAVSAGVNLGILFLWLVLGGFWPTAVFLYTEIVFGREVAKGVDEEAFTYPAITQEREDLLYRKATKFGVFTYVVVSVVCLLSLS